MAVQQRMGTRLIALMSPSGRKGEMAPAAAEEGYAFEDIETLIADFMTDVRQARGDSA
jgi:hypothetical protein